MSTIIFVYAATSPVNGFFGGSLYSRLGGNIYTLVYVQNILMIFKLFPKYFYRTYFSSIDQI